MHLAAATGVPAGRCERRRRWAVRGVWMACGTAAVIAGQIVLTFHAAAADASPRAASTASPAGSAAIVAGAPPASAAIWTVPNASVAMPAPDPSPAPSPSSSPGPSQGPGSPPQVSPSAAPSPCVSPTAVIGPGAPMPDVQCQNGTPAPTSPYQRARDNTRPDAGCSPWDMGCVAKQAVTGWFRDLVASGMKPTLTLLGSTVLATPSLSSPSMRHVRSLWKSSLVIANTSLVLLLTVGGVVVMAGGIAAPRGYSLAEIAPRLALGFLAANCSLILLGYAIGFANALSRALLHAGGQRIRPDQAAAVLTRGVEASINTGGIFLVLLALVVVILAACVAFIYIARLAITMVLIVAAPIALIFHTLPQTEGIARLWWRATGGVLAIQVAQSLVLVTTLRLLFTRHGSRGNGAFYGIPTSKGDLLDLLLMICLLYVLVRIPTWVARTIWTGGRPGMLTQLVKTLLIYRTVGAAINAITGTRSTARRAAPATPPRPAVRSRGGPGGAPTHAAQSPAPPVTGPGRMDRDAAPRGATLRRGSDSSTALLDRPPSTPTPPLAPPALADQYGRASSSPPAQRPDRLPDRSSPDRGASAASARARRVQLPLIDIGPMPFARPGAAGQPRPAQSADPTAPLAAAPTRQPSSPPSSSRASGPAAGRPSGLVGRQLMLPQMPRRPPPPRPVIWLDPPRVPRRRQGG